MSTSKVDHLVTTISELRGLFPNWRLGQLVANLTTTAGCQSVEAIWDIEDDRLLAAAQRLIERNSDRADSAN